jgi:hypothetical protein
MFNAKSLALWAAVFLTAANAVPCKPCNNGPRPQLDGLTGALPFSPPVPLPGAGSLAGMASGMASGMTGGSIGDTSSIPVVGGAGGPLDAAGSLAGAGSPGQIVGGATGSRGPLELLEDHVEDLAKVATGEKDPLTTLEEHAADDAGLIQTELGGGTAAAGAQ